MKTAFDKVAVAYDDAFTRTAVGYSQRHRVWEYLKAHSNLKNKKVLELNCGTGEDALWFATQGAKVLATDISQGMVEVAKQKMMEYGLNESINCKVLAIQNIKELEADNFDLIFSNFGGLNCLSANEIEKTSQELAAKLKPNGDLIVVIMPSFCLWESFYFLMKMKPRKAFRRMSSKAIAAQLDANTTIDTWYYSPWRIRQLFSKAFDLKRVFPVGFFVPPSYLDNAFVKYPKVSRFLMDAEDRLGKSILFGSLSDHCLIHLKKR